MCVFVYYSIVSYCSDLLFTNIRPICSPTAADVVPGLVDLPHVDAVVGHGQSARPVLSGLPVGVGPGGGVSPGPGPHRVPSHVSPAQPGVVRPHEVAPDEGVLHGGGDAGHKAPQGLMNLVE